MATKAVKKTTPEMIALVAEWKKVYDALGTETEEEHTYWVNEEADFESLCVGWCLAKGLPLAAALEFYQQMVPLELF